MSWVNQDTPVIKLVLELLDGQELERGLDELFVPAHGSSLVEFGVVEEVWGGFGHLREYPADELLLVLDLESVVLGHLSLQSAEVTFADVFAAGRAGSVGGVESNWVTDFFLHFLERVEEHFGKILFGGAWADSQVWSADFSQEDRISSKQTDLVIWLINQLKTRALQSMAGSM